jgi:glycosyltransferase involved in cell wall biosynthesis
MFDKPTPKVSVCVPVYNNDSTIKDTIQSLLLQTYSNIEILVVDNASTDKTALVLKSIEHKRLKVFSFTDHLTMEANVERAIELASGEYIAVFHGDDIYSPEIIAKEVCYLEKNADAAAVFTLGISIDIEGNFLENYPNPPEIEALASGSRSYEFMDIFKLILRDYNFLICPTAMVRAHIYRNLEVRWNNGKFKTSADLGVWMGILEKYTIGILPDRLIFNRHSGANRYSERARFLNTNKADFFLVLENYISRPEVAEFLTFEDICNYNFLVFQDNVLRGLNAIIANDYSLASELFSFTPIRMNNFFKNNNYVNFNVVKWSTYCLIGKVAVRTPLRRLFGIYLKKKLYNYG